MIVSTPEVVRRAFVDNHYIDPSLFSLLIFDECHHATGNSPYASIMRDVIWPVVKRQRDGSSEAVPRILGLTASFVNGTLNKIEEKRQELEVLLQVKRVGCFEEREECKKAAPVLSHHRMLPCAHRLSFLHLNCPRKAQTNRQYLRQSAGLKIDCPRGSRLLLRTG